MAENPTTTAQLAAEFTDKLAAELLIAPDPQYPFARYAYASAMAAEMQSMGIWDMISLQLRATLDTRSAKVGDPANIIEAMARGGEGTLDLMQGMVFPETIRMVKEAKQPGDNIKIARPKYLTDAISDSRWLSTTSALFGSSQPLQLDEVSVTIRESSGPGDANGATVPVSIPYFVQERAQHDLLTNAGMQFKRSRARWIHFCLQNLALLGTNVSYPAGISATTDFTGVDNEPFQLEMIPRLVEAMVTRSIPGLGGGELYLAMLHPHQVQQLENDPAYQRAGQFFQSHNILFPNYVKTVNNLVITRNSTLPTLSTLGAGGTTPGYQGIVLAPEALGWALAMDAIVRRDKNDDGERFFKAAWTAHEGFAQLNGDFVQKFYTT